MSANLVCPSYVWNLRVLEKVAVSEREGDINQRKKYPIYLSGERQISWNQQRLLIHGSWPEQGKRKCLGKITEGKRLLPGEE